MCSLSDRNMKLGDVLLPPGIKQRCLYLQVQGFFTLRKILLMQLSVALNLHHGRDSQLNTSEMFCIDISSWIFVVDADGFWSTYLGVLPIAIEPLPFFCSIVSIAVRF